jgi:alpha-glucosidase
MLGGNILVAPVDKKETSRNVVLPKGNWLADDGKKYKGGKTYLIDVPINRLPCFTLQK